MIEAWLVTRRVPTRAILMEKAFPLMLGYTVTFLPFLHSYIINVEMSKLGKVKKNTFGINMVFT